MSAITCSARSIFDEPFFTWVPLSFFTHCGSNTAVIGLMADSSSLSWPRRSFSSTPALSAAWYMSSGKRSQPPKQRSSSLASGTYSCSVGTRLSVRLPRRIVPIWVSEPIGFASPRLTARTPATNVVATAPIPGSSTPSLPPAGLTSTPFFRPMVLSSARQK